MSQSLSEEEFHRMQLQIIEMRTENYKLKDENKKQATQLKNLTEKELKLDKELNKQIKMKKALSTLNKSKQAQEYEALLRQTEQEFTLQNQTLMEELTKVTISIDKLEKENQQLKREGGNTVTDSSSDSDIRRLQAENKALRNSIESIQLKHKEELEQQMDLVKHAKSTQSLTNSTHVSSKADLQDPLSVHSENSSDSPTDATPAEVDDSSTSELRTNANDDISQSKLHGGGSDLMEERLLHAEAQCERLKQHVNDLEGVQVRYETEKEEKLLVEKALEEERSHHSREHRALASEVEAFREKLDRKQALYLSLQEEKEKLYAESQAKSKEITSLRDSAAHEVHEDKEKLKSEIASLGKALQNAQNLLERQQTSVDNFQTQIKLLVEEKEQLLGETNNLKEIIHQYEEKSQQHEKEFAAQLAQTRALEERVGGFDAKLERAKMEREDAVVKFEENARASGALLQRVDQVEQSNDSLRRELADAKELAEKRKKVMDKQAVESQEHNAKFTEQISSMMQEYEATTKQTRENYEEKIKALEHTCKRQEQELIRMNHQDRAKTREVDTCQQQLRDMQATVSSLESSKGWFERALVDAEKVAQTKQEEHEQEIGKIKKEHQADVEKVRSEISLKERLVAESELKVAEATQESSKFEEVINQLKQEVKDEVSKQRLVEKKGQAALKDLKRQLVNERKRNEKLQEKLGEMSSSNSNLDELLQVVDAKEGNGGDGSSVSSFSFRDLISPNKQTNSDSNSQTGSGGLSNSRTSTSTPPTVNVSKAESRDLLSRITSLQQEKWNLEEQVRHLEESAGGMADELLEKTKLLQQYVQHTRSDHHKARSSQEELGSRKFSDRMRSIITGQEEADVTNIRELNLKLTRMLEEEMMKNSALKQDLASLSEQLTAKK